MELLLYPDDLCFCFEHADIHEVESNLNKNFENVCLGLLTTDKHPFWNF